MTSPVTVSPESSIFADTRSHATSGGALYLGGNPTAAMLIGQGSQSWVMPAAIAAAVVVAFLLLRRR